MSKCHIMVLKFRDENWSFRRSLPVEKFSNLSFLNSEAFVHLKSSLLRKGSAVWAVLRSGWLSDPGQTDRMERRQVWTPSRNLRLEFSKRTRVKSSFASVGKVGPRTEGSCLCVFSPSLVSAVEDFSFSTRTEFFLFVMWGIKAGGLWLQKLLWKRA